MKKHGHGCERVSTEELLLFAYGESDDAAVAEHVRSCPACRAYLGMTAELREAAQSIRVAAPEFSPARPEKRAGTIAADPAAGRWRTRPALLVPLLAAAAVVLAVGLWLVRSSPDPAPLHLAGIQDRLSDQEDWEGRDFESRLGLNGSWSESADELELALLDLEDRMGIGGLYDEDLRLGFFDSDLESLLEAAEELESDF